MPGAKGKFADGVPDIMVALPKVSVALASAAVGVKVRPAVV